MQICNESCASSDNYFGTQMAEQIALLPLGHVWDVCKWRHSCLYEKTNRHCLLNSVTRVTSSSSGVPPDAMQHPEVRRFICFHFLGMRRRESTRVGPSAAPGVQEDPPGPVTPVEV